MSKYLAALATIGTMALIVRIDAAGNVTGGIDSMSNITPRVLDGSMVTAVETVHPFIAPDGTEYQPERINRRRSANLREMRHVCWLHLVFLGEAPDGCGYTASR